MKTETEKDNNLESSTRKKLDSIIEQTKTENEALKKILDGLEKMQKDTEQKINSKKKKSK